MLHCPKLPLKAARGQLKFIETEVEVEGLRSGRARVLEEGGAWTSDAPAVWGGGLKRLEPHIGGRR